MRFTTKGNDFYAVILNWSDNGILIKSLDKEAIADARILDISLLGSDEKINWKQTDEGLKIFFPEKKPCEYAYSFKISFDKKVGEHLKSEAVNEVMKHGAWEVKSTCPINRCLYEKRFRQPRNRNVSYLLPILKFAAKRMKRYVSTFAAN